MLKSVLEFIKKNNLIENGDRILIGLSGGADSVCLTHILYSLKSELNIELFAAHVNHGIRGKEAKRDEEFAQSFAHSLNIPVFIKHADVITEAKNRGISEEMCGRQIRYEFFEKTAKEYNINKIATAHNKNDTVETVLMNFIRGSSVAGLCGIPAMRGNIIRPILPLSRADIIAYVNENALDYVTDSTNLETVYTRNKIRLQLIPQIQQEFNANFIETTVKNAENMSYDREFLDIATDKALLKCVQDNKIDISVFNEEHISIQRRILYRMLTDKTGVLDISSSYINDLEQLIKSESGKRIDLPHGIEAIVEYGYLVIREKQKEIPDFEYEIPIGKEVEIKELGIKALIEKTDKNDKLAFTVPEDSVFTIRNRRDGDYFYPEGMSGRKKLKDYFIDEKIPRDERKKLALFTVNNEIAYIFGKRRDRRFDFEDTGVKLIIIK